MEKFPLPTHLEETLDAIENNSACERIVELFDLVADQCDQFVPAEELTIGAELFTGNVFRGVNDDGVETLIFHSVKLDDAVMVCRNGWAEYPEDGAAVYEEGKVDYETIYELLRGSEVFVMPTYDPIPRGDEVVDVEDETLVDDDENVLDPDEIEIGYEGSVED